MESLLLNMNRVSILAILAVILANLACVMSAVQIPTITPTPPPSASPSPVPTATATPRATEAAADTAVVRAAVVNVRAMPGGEVVGQIEAGQEVEIVACVDDWCQIVDPAGFVFIGCLSIADGQGCEAK
jgi:uncharacterized protein YgiM (DUF1202 family)